MSAYNSAHYGSFSSLLRTTFDEAAASFSDESIDILHIDGLHTYDAVSHNFNHWIGKVKPGGIVLLHDIMIRDAGSGVWRFWEELATAQTHFAFTHSLGLGVIRKPGNRVPDNGLFAAIFGSSDAYKNHIRRFYALVSAASASEYDAANRGASAAGAVRVQIYPRSGEYASEASIGHSLTTDRWERLSIDLPNGVGNSALRIDPAEQAAIIDISVVALRKPVDGQILWAATGASEVGALTTGGTLTRLTSDKNQEFCRFISSGTDPQLFLPALKAEQFDQPIVLEVWMRVQASAESVVRLLLETDKRQSENGASDAEHAEIASKRVIAEQHLASLRVEHEDMMRDLEAALHERNRVLQQHKTLIAEREACATEKESLALANRKLHSELYVAQTDLANARAEIATARLEFKKLRECREDRQRLEQAIEGIVHSYSWRITQPLRSAMLLLRGRPRSG